jgi:hypothetical protein
MPRRCPNVLDIGAMGGEAAKWGMSRDTPGGYHLAQMALDPGCDRSTEGAYGRSSFDRHRSAGRRGPYPG